MKTVKRSATLKAQPAFEISQPGITLFSSKFRKESTWRNGIENKKKTKCKCITFSFLCCYQDIIQKRVSRQAEQTFLKCRKAKNRGGSAKTAPLVNNVSCARVFSSSKKKTFMIATSPKSCRVVYKSRLWMETQN